MLTLLGISNTNELKEVILKPKIYDSVWQNAKMLTGIRQSKITGQYAEHDFHDLQLLHDTVCFIQQSGGKIRQESILTLRDYFQDTADYVGQCVIPSLQELGLIMYIPDDDVIALTEKGYELQPSPRLLDIEIQ